MPERSAAACAAGRLPVAFVPGKRLPGWIDIDIDATVSASAPERRLDVCP
ncbi:hypothetical protein [Streptomyces sp. TRM70350]|nr:hypothetical protein [Streptomyces sp. TRM70350]MBV7697528.1 hypothetical protein [Streptomyces sp. TRM70350]